MECADCGYVLSPFETKCPRCEKYGKPQPKQQSVVSPTAIQTPADPTLTMLPCDKCGQLVAAGSTNCRSCGAIQTLLQPQQPGSTTPSPHRRWSVIALGGFATLFVLAALGSLVWVRSHAIPSQPVYVGTWASKSVRDATVRSESFHAVETARLVIDPDHHGSLLVRVDGRDEKEMEKWCTLELMMDNGNTSVAFKIIDDYTSSTSLSEFTWSNGKSGADNYLITVDVKTGKLAHLRWSVTEDGNFLTLTSDTNGITHLQRLKP